MVGVFPRTCMLRPRADSVLLPGLKSAQTCLVGDIESGSRTRAEGLRCFHGPGETTACSDALHSRNLMLGTRDEPIPAVL